MSYPIYYLDTFTDRPFGGNPTAVVCADLSMQAETMQAIAAELNLPVTAFIIAKKDQPAGYIYPVLYTNYRNSCLWSCHAGCSEGSAFTGKKQFGIV